MKSPFSQVGLSLAVVAMLLISTIVTAAESPRPAARPKIDPKAEELLKRACATLAAENNFEFHAEITFDEVLPSGVKLQYAAALDMARTLPNRLAVAFASDLGSKRFWYDGKMVTLLDGTRGVYGSLAVESSIGGMLTEILDKANFTVPLSDLAVSDPCDLLQRVDYGIYVGLGDVEGGNYDHLAFAGKHLDFQIWLERGKRALPRKIVITYTNLPQSPQYTAIFTDWSFPKEIPLTQFEPEIPKGVLHVDFLAAKKATEPENLEGGKTK